MMKRLLFALSLTVVAVSHGGTMRSYRMDAAGTIQGPDTSYVDPATATTPTQAGGKEFTVKLKNGERAGDWYFYDKSPTSGGKKSGDSVATGKTVTIKVTDSNDRWLVAHCAWIQYGLRYRNDDSVGGKTGYFYTNNVKIAAIPSAPTGYRYPDVWSLEGGTKTFQPGASVTGADFGLKSVHVDTTVITLRVDKVANRYAISYRGLDDASGYPTAADYDSEIELPMPQKAGASFAGWMVVSGLESSHALWRQSESGWSSIGNSYTPVKADSRNPVQTVWMKNLNSNNATSVTLEATWVEKKTVVTLDHEGAKNKPTDSIEVVYGAPPGGIGTIPEYKGKDFAGYYTEPEGGGIQYWNAEGRWCGPGQVWTREESALTVYARTIVQQFFVAFDGNGATNETPMATEAYTCDFPAKLPPNAYGRPGYTFGGWATNETGSVVYADEAERADNFGVSKDETRTLYAVWKTNTYYLAFDPNGGTVMPGKEPMPLMTNRWDAAQELPENVYTNGELLAFGGWSNTWNGAVYENQASVSNAYDVAGGTNTLVAVWNSLLTDLSKAMGCTNLLWFASGTKPNVWTAVFEESVGYRQSGHCARRTEMDGRSQFMSAGVVTNGLLRFRWKSTEGGKLDVRLGSGTASPQSYSWDTSSKDDWQVAEYKVDDPNGNEIRITNVADVEVEIDAMTWFPGGKAEPQQGDPVAPTAAGVEGGVFSLTIPTSAGTDYGVWTNADLTVPSAEWGFWKQETATDATTDFSFEMLPGVPQLFFRAFKLK